MNFILSRYRKCISDKYVRIVSCFVVYEVGAKVLAQNLKNQDGGTQTQA